MKHLIIALVFVCMGSFLKAQDHEGRFENEIAAFEQQDRQDFPLKGGIVFTGSSSIRMWNDLKDRFAGYHIISLGFQGCVHSYVTYYVSCIVYPYRPSYVFVYAGDKDFAAG